jgi:hypothetical protein
MDVLLLRDTIAEAGNRYAASLNVEPTDDWIILKTLEEAGELVQSFLRYSARARDRGLTAEELKRMSICCGRLSGNGICPKAH